MWQHRQEAGVIDTASNEAIKYGVSNGAVNPPQVVLDINAATVVVTATVTEDTFFAGVIGNDSVSPRAAAEAACRPPGVGVLPVAWSCRETVVGEIKCTDDIGPCCTLADPTGMNCSYVLMDSVKVRNKNKKCDPDDPPCYVQNDLECSLQQGTPPNCIPVDPTKIDCYLDNDCVDELAAGGSRSWLDLDGGGGGANELKNWISGAVAVEPINVHTWLPEESGVTTSIFHITASYLVEKNVVLPVFDKVCNGLPTTADPETLAQCNSGTIDIQDLITNSTLTFHIISFSAFHVTCVQTGKNKVVAEPGYFLHASDKSCYGHDRAVNNNSIDDNDKTIEEYFVRENLGGFGGPGDWYDTGTFTVAWSARVMTIA